MFKIFLNFASYDGLRLHLTVNYKATGTILLWRSILGRSTEGFTLLSLKTIAWYVFGV